MCVCVVDFVCIIVVVWSGRPSPQAPIWWLSGIYIVGDGLADWTE